MTIHRPSRRSVLAGAGAGALASVSACGSGPRAAGDLTFWGASGDSIPLQQQLLDTFAAKHPGARVSASVVPNSDAGGASIITAVRGGTAPDIWLIDRFTVPQYAAMGLLEPITPLVQRYEGVDDDTFTSRWLDFAVGECTYDGQLYALPQECDSRGLFYNKTVLREAGFDLDELDPSNPPLTFDRVFEMSARVTRTDARGNYEALGLIPWADEANGYTWSVGEGATYFDQDACGVDMLAEPSLRAFERVEQWRDELGYRRVDVFNATFSPPSSPPSANTFLTGRRAFMVTSPWFVSSIRQYAPDLDYGVTHLPVGTAGDRPYTWSGGWALATPKGSVRSEQCWEFLKFYCGYEGQALWMKPLNRIPTERDVLADPNLTDPSVRFFIDELQHSTSRPPLPVGQLWWDSLTSAGESILFGQDARGALQEAQDRLTPQMEPYCPFELPAKFTAGAVA